MPTIEWKSGRYSVDYGWIMLGDGKYNVATIMYVRSDNYRLQMDLPGFKAEVKCTSLEAARTYAQQRIDMFTQLWKAAK